MEGEAGGGNGDVVIRTEQSNQTDHEATSGLDSPLAIETRRQGPR